MIVALTGFMGSGKSTVGALVADRIGCPFLDLDSLIEKKAGRTVPQIFSEEGEAGFRRLEKQVLDATLRKYAESTVVLALGGGTVTLPGVPALLQKQTLCIYLKASLETLQERIAATPGTRPLADDRLAARLQEREPLYAQAAHISLDTDGLTPDDLADEIVISCL